MSFILSAILTTMDSLLEAGCDETGLDDIPYGEWEKLNRGAIYTRAKKELKEWEFKFRQQPGNYNLLRLQAGCVWVGGVMYVESDGSDEPLANAY